jgi:chromosome segregation protein
LNDEDGVLGSLVDLVELDEKAMGIGRVLLGDAIVVDGLPRALELWSRGNLDRTLVTLEGDRVEPSGIVVGGSSEALDSALLQQKREIGDLEGIVTQLEEELRVAKQRHQGFAERLAEVEQARETGEVELLELEKQRLGAVQRRDSLRERTERSAAEIKRRTEQGDQLAAELAEASSQVESLSAELERARDRLPKLREEMAASSEKKRFSEAQRESVQAELSEARVALARWQQDRAALASTRERLQRQVSAERERARRLTESVTGWRARIDEIDASVVTLGQEHHDMVQAHKSAADGKIAAQEACDETRNAVAEVEVTLKNLRGSLDTQRDALAEVELGLRELDLERSHITEDISHRYDRRIEETLLDYHARGVAGEAEAKQVVHLKRILGRMGEVNLTAIREYDEVSERFEYLTSQRADLEDAIGQLEEAIERINKTTRERFKTTFEQVNERFKEVFPRLFSGGRAELVMTDPTDLLATGVEIFAQPPGKKIVSLELLSGGEKALTAVSLIFAIFLNKPSPFCLLDEVDAPLDEANVGRFCDLVRELSVQTQFIIITHNKRTMETADRLYGVTMQQRGVSKLVSVNLRRSIEEAQLN